MLRRLHRKSFLAVVPVAVLFLFGARADAQIETEGKPRLRVGSIAKTEVNLDGVLSEPAWAAADSIQNLSTVEPEEGGVPVGRTIIKVVGNPDEIIIGALCYDPDPNGIVSFSKALDSELDNEDHIKIVLDTFLDGRSGYVFAVNPSAARFDGLVSGGGEDINSDWDAIWEAKTSRDENGWSAEIRIPIKSIVFKRDLADWGFNVERRVQRLQETSRWSAVSQDYELTQTSQAGILRELPEFDFGLGLTVRGTMTGRAVREGPEEPRNYDADPSLDVTQKIGPNILTSLTVNTDFAETEVDARQVNLTRFEILFPEKRDFFLEGADIFEFGVGLDDDLVPFFSRRIGLFFAEEGDDGIAIPIDVGGKMNGRIGNTNMGALAVRTRGVDDLELSHANMGVVRVKQNIFAESSVGMIATLGDQLGNTGSWLTGADFTYQTSRFRGDKNLVFGAWGLVNDRDDLEGDKSAYGLAFEYPNDLWDVSAAGKRIGDGFDPSLGFVPRRGVDIWDGGVEFKPRPSWPFVRQMFHELALRIVNNRIDHQVESYQVTAKPVEWLLESGDGFGFSIIPEGDRPVEDFEVFETEDKTVTIPAGSYGWTRYRLEGTTAEKRKIRGEVAWESGGFYGGDLDTVEAALIFNWPLFTVELGAERNKGDLPGGDFTQRLYSGRFELKFTPDLQFSSFVQYDNESDSLGTNSRLRWRFSPVGDLFVVYNHNLQRSVRERRVWSFDANELVIKLQYALRF